jgi:hypothetical protein
MASPIERIKPEEAMHEQGRIEHRKADGSLPRHEQYGGPRLHGVDRAHAKSVIEEVR